MNTFFHSNNAIKQAADAIASADSILIAAGAGMGVDSGLPDFRGRDGFWRAYPQFKHLGLSFEDLANPIWFDRKPEQAWGFYGHRFNLYRKTQPHEGFTILKKWLDHIGNGFIFTSNVDGHFQKAGFRPSEVYECHGAINYLQCHRPCGYAIWDNDANDIPIDEKTMQALAPLPICPNCGAVARPNILMFGDSNWVPDRTDEQASLYRQWRIGAGANLVIIEIGAGKAVPTVRWECESLGGHLIRINPRDSDAPIGSISIPLGAKEALQRIDDTLRD